MSTGLISRENTKIKNLNRFAELARLGEVVFHTGDLANLWQISSKNTLYTTIKRYVERGLLFRIHKGYYAIKDPKNIDPLLLGVKAIHGNVYVSTETILAEEGVIQQNIPAITLVSNQSKRFSVVGNAYYSRQLADSFLYQSKGIITLANGVRKASKERAIADLLYFNPHAYFDAEKLINWKKVRSLQKDIGYPLTPQRYA
jgi:predicted transcriptional regulator of viral defense system